LKPATAKAKGVQTENMAVEWLRANGFIYAERRHLKGAADEGDVTGIPGVTIEVKSAATWAPVRWQRELRAEMENTGDEIGFCMCRPKATLNVDDWVFTVPGDVLLELLTEAGYRVRP